MNKTITIYELLGLVKDGKAPNKIKFCDEIFTFNNDKCNFLYKYQIGKCQLFGCCKLNDTVEIIEDNDKLEKLEKEELFAIDEGMTKSSLVAWQKANNGIFKKQIDFLIDHINKIEEKLDE